MTPDTTPASRWKPVAAIVLLCLLTSGAALWVYYVRAVGVAPLPIQQARQALPMLPKIIAPLLHKHVDSNGMVDYAALQQKPQAIDHYLSIASAISPDSHPGLFPTRAHKLAYWINAYNVSILKCALLFPTWKHLSSTARRASFFGLTRFTFGGTSTNLRDLENHVIRARFGDPRIHFAINCASFGCPKLPREPFRAKTLEAQLQRETKRFVSETRNVALDPKRKEIVLSSLFQWFRGDFLSWMQTRKHRTTGDPILAYINLYRSPIKAIPTKGYTIRYRPYDWRINDQAGPRRNTAP